jgi:hypothetical protein
MAEMNERLAAIMAKQEQKKQAAAEKAKQEAAEKAKAEGEARRGELSKESEAVEAKIAETEAAASEAATANEQFKAYAAEQGADLDPEVKAELDAEIAASEAKAAQANAKLAELRSEKATIDATLASLGGGEGAAAAEAAPAEVPVEAAAEAPAAEVPSEAPIEAAAEAPAAEVVAEQPAMAAEAQMAAATAAEKPAEVAEAEAEKEKETDAVDKKLEVFFQSRNEQMKQFLEGGAGTDDKESLGRITRMIENFEKITDDKFIKALGLSEEEKASVSPEKLKGLREYTGAFLTETKGQLEHRMQRFDDAKKVLFDKKWEHSWAQDGKVPDTAQAYELLDSYTEVLNQGKGSEIYQDRGGIVAMMRNDGAREDALKAYEDKAIPSYADQKAKFLNQEGIESAEEKEEAQMQAVADLASKIHVMNGPTGLPSAAKKAIDANYMKVHQKEFAEASIKRRGEMQKESAAEAAKELQPLYAKAVTELTTAIQDLTPETSQVLDLTANHRNAIGGAVTFEFFARDAMKAGADVTPLFAATRKALENRAQAETRKKPPDNRILNNAKESLKMLEGWEKKLTPPK